MASVNILNCLSGLGLKSRSAQQVTPIRILFAGIESFVETLTGCVEQVICKWLAVSPITYIITMQIGIWPVALTVELNFGSGRGS